MPRELELKLEEDYTTPSTLNAVESPYLHSQREFQKYGEDQISPTLVIELLKAHGLYNSQDFST